jgi:hypothetical protein
VIAAKSGHATNAVMLSLTGGSPLYADCDPLGAEGNGAEPAPRLAEWFASFDTDYAGSVCQADYVAFFDDAITTVARGCAQFTPG